VEEMKDKKGILGTSIGILVAPDWVEVRGKRLEVG